MVSFWTAIYWTSQIYQQTSSGADDLDLILNVQSVSGRISSPGPDGTSANGEVTISRPMTPTITAFERSPDCGRGLARDMRVRWALEEVGAVLLRLKAVGLLDEYRNLCAYVARGEARPAYGRAFAAQLRVFIGEPATR
jgi:hypothetical protein